MATMLKRLLLTVTVCVTTCVTGFVTYPLHEPTDDGKLSLDEEAFTVNVDYENEFTEITCRAHNYLTITWEKGGQPINETLVNLWDNQQRLRFEHLKMTDSGYYTCEASNGMTTINRTIDLHVISTACDVELRPINLQHHGCNNVSAKLGDNVVFDCQFFIGLNLWNLGYWAKMNESADAPDDPEGWILLDDLTGGTVFNQSEYETGKLVKNGVECDCRDCKSVQGSKLSIKNITAEAYGIYVVNIYNGGLETWIALELTPVPDLPKPVARPADWHNFLTIPVACVFAVCFLVLLGWLRFKTDIKLKWKDFASKKDHSKTNDVYLSYDWSSDADRGFAISLAHCLGERGYRVFFEIDCLPGGDTDEDILEGLKTSCRCIIIFSPEYLASHRNLDVIFAMDNAKDYKQEIIPIIYRDISAVTGDEQSALVKQILATQCLRYDRIPSQPLSKVQKVVHSVLPDRYSERSLHKELLLRLPPRDKPSCQPVLDFTSESDLITAETPPHVSSRESIGKYHQTSDIARKTGICSGTLDSVDESPTVIQCTSSIRSESKLYPDICGFSNSVESTHF